MKYQVRRQLTVSLENVPGRLATIAAALAENGINIDALSTMDSFEQGVIRLVASDPSACRQMLTRRSLNVIDTDVLVMELTDAPGLLAKISRALADGKVNIDYGYATTAGVGSKTKLILRVTPLDKARQVLDAIPD
jgi:hypothetical protein